MLLHQAYYMYMFSVNTNHFDFSRDPDGDLVLTSDDHNSHLSPTNSDLHLKIHDLQSPACRSWSSDHKICLLNFAIPSCCRSVGCNFRTLWVLLHGNHDWPLESCDIHHEEGKDCAERNTAALMKVKHDQNLPKSVWKRFTCHAVH